MSYIYVVQMDIPAPHEAEFNRIYDTEHVPQRRALPGFESATRWVCLSGWPRWLRRRARRHGGRRLRSPGWRSGRDAHQGNRRCGPRTRPGYGSRWQRPLGLSRSQAGRDACGRGGGATFTGAAKPDATEGAAGAEAAPAAPEIGMGMFGGMGGRGRGGAAAPEVKYTPTAWGRYIKVLLSSSEFVFIN